MITNANDLVKWLQETIDDGYEIRVEGPSAVWRVERLLSRITYTNDGRLEQPLHSAVVLGVQESEGARSADQLEVLRLLVGDRVSVELWTTVMRQLNDYEAGRVTPFRNVRTGNGERLELPQHVRISDGEEDPISAQAVVSRYLPLALDGPLDDSEIDSAFGSKVAAFLNRVRAAAEALAEFHRAGVVHQDVRSANLCFELVAGRPTCSIIDLGSARPVGRGQIATSAERYYQPPELLYPEQRARLDHSAHFPNERSDVYQIGAAVADARDIVLDREIPNVGARDRIASKQLDTLIEACTAEFEARPRTMRQVCDLIPVLPSRFILPPPPPSSGGRRRRRTPARFLGDVVRRVEEQHIVETTPAATWAVLPDEVDIAALDQRNGVFVLNDTNFVRIREFCEKSGYRLHCPKDGVTVRVTPNRYLTEVVNATHTHMCAKLVGALKELEIRWGRNNFDHSDLVGSLYPGEWITVELDDSISLRPDGVTLTAHLEGPLDVLAIGGIPRTGAAQMDVEFGYELRIRSSTYKVVREFERRSIS